MCVVVEGVGGVPLNEILNSRITTFSSSDLLSVGSQRRNYVVLMSMRRDDVAITSV